MSYMRKSLTEERSTPADFFDKLNAVFDFEIDVCASRINRKCQVFFDKKTNGLTASWRGARCWMNPPFGRRIVHWLVKAREEARKGATVVCLLPVRSDAGWWHDHVMKGELYFLRGRLRFSDAEHNAPFPLAVVVFSREKGWRLDKIIPRLTKA